MEFRILGPLEVVADGRLLELGGPKQRLLLALLVLRAGEVVSTDRLIEDLWADDAPRTAASALQVHVANLRKALGAGADLLVTRPPGYVLNAVGDCVDLRRFERLADDADASDPRSAAEILRAALDLWRGRPLADLMYEPALQTAIARLEELRLSALERRIDADLALGRHAPLVAELEVLVREHAFRERLHGQLMLALYRSGRQADALAAFRKARAALSEELAIDPGPELRRLEQAILTQDPALDLSATPAAASAPVRPRSLLLVLDEPSVEDALIGLGRMLVEHAAGEVVLVRALARGADVRAATADLNERRAALLAGGVTARVAAFGSADPDADVARLAGRLDVALVLGAGVELLTTPLPCDVAVLFPREGQPPGRSAVIAPFGGGEHDWAAVEFAAWVAAANGAPLRLAGAADVGGRDASLALADASLAVQYALGVAAEPLLIDRGDEALLEAAQDAGLLVVGLSDRWRVEGVGPFRLQLARRAKPAVVLVRRGLRPGGLAPRESMTRFTWSLAPAVAAPPDA